jgi:rhodanese-related sulfurtransferase
MKRKFLLKLVYCGLAMAFFAFGAAQAANDEVPRIPIAELKKLIDDKADIVILDAQLKEVYNKGHIKGAKSFPWNAEIAPEDAQGLPKEKLIIVYCDCGPGEADSSDVAAQLIRLGFDNVKVLADPSIRGWTKLGYPIEK